jgi:hypothetical protein
MNAAPSKNTAPASFEATLRVNAAIALRIPNSGIEQLDQMIREARRRDVATAALRGLLADGDRLVESLIRKGMSEESVRETFAGIAIGYADALLNSVEGS